MCVDCHDNLSSPTLKRLRLWVVKYLHLRVPDTPKEVPKEAPLGDKLFWVRQTRSASCVFSQFFFGIELLHLAILETKCEELDDVDVGLFEHL